MSAATLRASAATFACAIKAAPGEVSRNFWWYLDGRRFARSWCGSVLGGDSAAAIDSPGGAAYPISVNGPPSSQRRVVAAPAPSHPELRARLLNVDCTQDGDVEWLWTETPAGHFVSGYRIVARVHPSV